MTSSTNSENGKTKQKKDIKNEYVQKLSNEKALAEAALIGNKPSLIVVDFTDSNPTIGIMDSLAHSEDIRFKPELLSNRPYSFRDKQEFDSYIHKAENETLDSLFDRTLAIWKKYIDADDFHLKICVADTIYTYFQDRIGTTHYLFFVADNDAGKSNNLTMFNVLGYRNLMSTSMTHSNIYNFLGNREEGVGTICIDEADTIDQYPEIMSILKSGYTKGFPVVRMIDTSNGRKQLRLYTYGFKALAAERLPDAVEARGFMQRSIVLRCIPGFPLCDISEVTDPAGDDEYEELLNELNELRNLLFCYRLVHFKDRIPNIKLNIRNREKQLFKPLLRIFQGTRTFDVLKPVISNYIRERRETKANSYHAFLYRMVNALTDSQKTLQLRTSNIWDFVKMNVDYKDIPYRPQSIETVEFGVLSQKGMIQTLQDVFDAKPPKHRGSARELVFSQKVLDRMRDTYDLDIEIKVDFETHETLETLSGGIGWYPPNNDIEENEEKTEENSENYQETDTEPQKNDVKEVADTPSYPQNASHASQASQTPKMSTNRYQTEGTDTKTMCLNVSQTQMTAERQKLTDSVKKSAEQARTVGVNTRDKNYDVFGGRKCRNHEHEDDFLCNPYIVGKDGTKEECIEKFEVYFHDKIRTDAEFKRKVLGCKGKKIGCPGNCKPRSCHLDIVVDYLNNLIYSDYLIDGVPIWQIENRGMTEKEAEAYKDEYERLKMERGEA